MALDAGAFRQVSLANGIGGVQTRLILTGGVYHLSRLTLGTDAAVECDAPCELRVAGRVLIGSRSSVGPGPAAGMGSGNVELLVAGANGSSLPTALPAALNVDTDAALSAYVLAPNGTARFGQRGDFFGKVVARDVLFSIDGAATGEQLALIVEQPSDLTVQQGNAATFTVSVAGSGVTYQWQRNGVDIPGATGTSYTLGAAAPSNDGDEFRVIVTNVAGSVRSEEAVLTVDTCTATDPTCDGVDDDCDGTTDDDYLASCSGNAVQSCVAGSVVTQECGDGNACNGAETCSTGACLAGTAPSVDDGNPCTADSCAPATGVVHAAVAAGTACADSDLCNGDETCSGAGTCVAGTAPAVDDGNPCTADSCEPATGVVHVAVATGTACADNDLCNGDETCSGAGACVAGTAPAVDDGNPCTADSCDPATGVVHMAVATGTACADNAVQRRRDMQRCWRLRRGHGASGRRRQPVHGRQLRPSDGRVARGGRGRDGLRGRRPVQRRRDV